jgi:hypothetical protein
MTTATKTASEKQLNLIANLRTEKVLDDTADVLISTMEGMDEVPSKFASALITHLFSLARIDGQETTSKRFEPAEGFYRKGEDIFRVVISKSGNWYAKLAKKPAEGSGRKSLDYEYVGKRVRLDDAEQMSDAEAGKFLGYCVRCGAELTVPESIERGMGPTCAQKVGVGA